MNKFNRDAKLSRNSLIYFTDGAQIIRDDGHQFTIVVLLFVFEGKQVFAAIHNRTENISICFIIMELNETFMWGDVSD